MNVSFRKLRETRCGSEVGPDACSPAERGGMTGTESCAAFDDVTQGGTESVPPNLLRARLRSIDRYCMSFNRPQQAINVVSNTLCTCAVRLPSSRTKVLIY